MLCHEFLTLCYADYTLCYITLCVQCESTLIPQYSQACISRKGSASSSLEQKDNQGKQSDGEGPSMDAGINAVSPNIKRPVT